MQPLKIVFNNRSLWYKFTILSILPAIIVTAVIGIGMIEPMEMAMVKESQSKADALTTLSQQTLCNPFVIYNKNLLDNLVDGLGRIQGVNYALVIDFADNRILAHNNHHLDGKLASELPRREEESYFEDVSFPNDLTDAKRLYVKSVPITIEGKQYASLHIGYSLETIHQTIVSIKCSILIVALLAVAIGISLALLVSKIISIPIQGLAQQAKRAGEGDFEQPLVYKSKDAIGQLANAFNQMLAAINEKHAQLRTINTIADAVYRSLDIHTVAQNAVNAMINYSQYPGVALFLYDSRHNQLILIHAHGFDQSTLNKSARLPLKGSLTGVAIESRQIVSSLDISADGRLVSSVKQALMAEKLQSVLSVPLMAQDQVLGAMNLIYKSKYSPSNFEKETLLAIGKTVGLAIFNARQMARIQDEVEDRKEAETALRESENKYRNLVERANDGIVILQDGLIRFANPSAISLSGQAPADFIGQPFTAYLHPSEKTKVSELYKQRMADESPSAIYETIFVREDGKQIYAEVNAGRTTYLNRPADLVLIRDISERKQAQEALKQAYDHLEVKVAERTAELAIAKERAEESDRLKSAFLAAMSHELRTPLNSIIGFTGIILQKLVGPLNDEQVKQLTMVQGSAHHLLSLINDVLDLSKIEAGQLNVISEDFDMKEAVSNVANSVLPMVKQKNLQLIVEISPAVGAIASDRRRVEQILLNLLNNAIKFTEKGQIVLSCYEEEGLLTTTVKDTGIGIAPADTDKLFKAFQQIETGLARRFEGTGLGLSICKKLVELLGGKISAHSEGLDHGSTFTFSLPTGE